MHNLICPNCGSNIEFGDEDYEVNCNSCKRSFIIERNIPRNMEIEYKLVAREVDNDIEIAHIFKIIPIIIAIIIIASAIIFINNQVNVFNRREQNSNYTVNSEAFKIKDISSSDINNLIEISKKELNTKNSNKSCITIKDYEYIGSYLYKSNNKYFIMDVFETVRKNDLNKEFSFYACAVHNNVVLENGKLLYNDTCSIIGNNISTISTNYSEGGLLSLKGYFTINEIYDYIKESYDFIDSSDSLKNG